MDESNKKNCECGQPRDVRKLECLKNYTHKSMNKQCLVCGDEIYLGSYNSSQGVEVKIKWKC